MCMFSGPIRDVSNTRIFARAVAGGSQFLVYQMKYGSNAANAMILPVPIRQPAQSDSLRFIDLKEYPEFFADLSQGFPYRGPAFGIGCAEVPKSPTGQAKLEVQKVGNYIASFVPTLADFARLDPRFTLPQKTWSKLPQYANYGFAVFQLAAGSLEPHPMAFEFASANSSIYFPTLHIHDGEIHATEEFEHALYLQHAGFDSRVGPYRNSWDPDPKTGLVRSEDAAKTFCDAAKSQGVVNPNLLVHRLQMFGDFPNQDTIIATYGDPTIPTFNVRRLWSYWPWLIVAAFATWFLARRSKLMHADKQIDIPDAATDGPRGTSA